MFLLMLYICSPMFQCYLDIHVCVMVPLQYFVTVLLFVFTKLIEWVLELLQLTTVITFCCVYTCIL